MGYLPFSQSFLKVLLKDGNHGPAAYVFGLNYEVKGQEISWNGTDTIELKGFWPVDGAISNVSIFGAVPEPGTLILLGAGLASVVLARRRKTLQGA